MKIYIAAAAVAIAAIAGNGWLNTTQRLSADNAQLQQQLKDERGKASGYELLIQRLTDDLIVERDSYAQLQRTQTELTAAGHERTQLIRRLQRENQELKNWAAVELPAAVKCLRHRPAITTAADYAAWLSSGNGLPAACQPPEQ